MDTIEIEHTHLAAGEEYLRALQQSGLDPECLFWVYDTEDSIFLLMLVTSLHDVVGPLAIQQSLFKAYNASVTPKEIDPFIVQVVSTKSNLVREFGVLQTYKAPSKFNDDNGNLMFESNGPWEVESRFLIHKEWVYKFSPDRRRVGDLPRQWRHFHDRIEQLAA